MFAQTNHAGIMGHWCYPPGRAVSISRLAVISILLLSKISLLQVHVREGVLNVTRSLQSIASDGQTQSVCTVPDVYLFIVGCH